MSLPCSGACLPHANLRDPRSDRLADTGPVELSQGVGVEDVRVLEYSSSSQYDWESLFLTFAKFFAAGPAGCEDWSKVLCTVLQPWQVSVSALIG